MCAQYYLEGVNETPVAKFDLSEVLGEPVLGWLKESTSEIKMKSFEITDLSLKFSRLKTDKDILKFANTYGLLVIRLKKGVERGWDELSLDDFEYGHYEEMYESLRLWRWHINHIRKLIKLGNALKNGDDVEEKELLYLESYKPAPISDEYAMYLKIMNKVKGTNAAPTPTYRIRWGEDKRQAGFTDLENLNIIGASILFNNIQSMLKNGIFIDYSTVHADPDAPLGIRFEDRKATNFLLTAIYYDLWSTTYNKEPVKICSVCQEAFTSKRKDARYCSDACRKKHERTNKKVP